MRTLLAAALTVAGLSPAPARQTAEQLPLRAVASIAWWRSIYAAGENEDAGTMSVWVEDSAGAVPLRWRPVPVPVQSGGSILHGM